MMTENLLRWPSSRNTGPRVPFTINHITRANMVSITIAGPFFSIKLLKIVKNVPSLVDISIHGWRNPTLHSKAFVDAWQVNWGQWSVTTVIQTIKYGTNLWVWIIAEMDVELFFRAACNWVQSQRSSASDSCIPKCVLSEFEADPEIWDFMQLQNSRNQIGSGDQIMPLVDHEHWGRLLTWSNVARWDTACRLLLL